MTKIIFLDVDGTLVDYTGELPESAVSAIRQARKKGHKVYLCTGRSRAEIYEELWDIGIDGLIGGNGSYIESQGEVISHHVLSVSDSKKIVDYLHQEKLEFYLESNNGLFASKNFESSAEKTIQEYVKRKGDKYSKEMTVRKAFPEMIFNGELYRDDLNKVSYILNNIEDFKRAKLVFPELQHGTWGGLGEEALFGDIALKDIHKGNAAKKLLEYLSLDKKDSIAFGDAKIDIPMLEYCEIGVAMGSAGPEIKEMADIITGDVDKDGLYQAFEKLNLL
ncbi:MAG: Cof-type HAD-IIB family hydrolase [Lactovum sp.]